MEVRVNERTLRSKKRETRRNSQRKEWHGACSNIVGLFPAHSQFFRRCCEDHWDADVGEGPYRSWFAPLVYAEVITEELKRSLPVAIPDEAMAMIFANGTNWLARVIDWSAMFGYYVQSLMVN